MFSAHDLRRLPIDVLVGDPDRSKRPGRQEFPLSASDYARLHAEALASNDFAGRVSATWGLIAQEDQGVSWAREQLTPANEESMVNGLSVLGWLGVPSDLVPYLTSLLDQLPDSELRSAIHSVLPDSAISAHEAAEEAVAPAGDGVPLKGGMDPFTEVIYFVHSPYEKFLRAFRDAWGRFGRAKEHRGNLADLLRLLEPYSHPHHKTLAVECQGDWTALFDQGADLT